jgi:hypothetical protein
LPVASPFTFDTDTGELVVETSDFTYDRTSRLLRISKESIEATSTSPKGTYEFTVSFLDDCWDAILVSAEFDQALYESELYIAL